jgi:hypothetical protein
MVIDVGVADALRRGDEGRFSAAFAAESEDREDEEGSPCGKGEPGVSSERKLHSGRN